MLICCCIYKYRFHETRLCQNHLHTYHHLQILIYQYHVSCHCSNLPHIMYQKESNICHTHVFNPRQKSLNISTHYNNNMYPNHFYAHLKSTPRNSLHFYMLFLYYHQQAFHVPLTLILLINYQLYFIKFNVIARFNFLLIKNFIKNIFVHLGSMALFNYLLFEAESSTIYFFKLWASSLQHINSTILIYQSIIWQIVENLSIRSKALAFQSIDLSTIRLFLTSASIRNHHLASLQTILNISN